MAKVINKPQLPKRLAQAWGWKAGACWSAKEVQDRDLCLHVVFKDRLCNQFLACAVSYNTRTHITSGILGCTKRFNLSAIEALADTAHHPFTVPLFAYEYHFQICLECTEMVRDQLFEIDYGLGLNTNPAIATIPLPPANYQKLNRTIVSASEALLVGVPQMVQGMSKSLQEAFCILDSVSNELGIDPANEQLKSHFSFLNQGLEYQTRVVEDYKRRIPVFSSALYNLMAQRDNRLNISVAADSRRIASQSRRDSSAMKTIAVLTIIFLPGTFVSAIFSTSIFNFRSNDGPTTSPNFWIYWAITIPLTIVVVGIWAAWYHWNDRKQAIQDSDLEKSIDSADGTTGVDNALPDGDISEEDNAGA